MRRHRVEPAVVLSQHISRGSCVPMTRRAVRVVLQVVRSLGLRVIWRYKLISEYLTCCVACPLRVPSVNFDLSVYMLGCVTSGRSRSHMCSATMAVLLDRVTCASCGAQCSNYNPWTIARTVHPCTDVWLCSAGSPSSTVITYDTHRQSTMCYQCSTYHLHTKCHVARTNNGCSK